MNNEKLILGAFCVVSAGLGAGITWLASRKSKKATAKAPADD